MNDMPPNLIQCPVLHPWQAQHWDGTWLIIPDLHGHAPRLSAALRVAATHPQTRLAFLGDLIDDSPRRREARGVPPAFGSADDSRFILETVRQLAESGRAEVLLGNHEVMAAASVLDDDRAMMNIWWQVGGKEAAASYNWDGRGEAGKLADDLRWLCQHAHLWLSIGPPDAQVLLSHATRPSPTRYQRGQNSAADLLPNGTEDDVVWYPLGLESDQGATLRSLSLLTDDFTASLHGHMETPELWTLLDTDAVPAYQLDLHPKRHKLALMHLSDTGELTRQVVRI